MQFDVNFRTFPIQMEKSRLNQASYAFVRNFVL